MTQTKARTQPTRAGEASCDYPGGDAGAVASGSWPPPRLRQQRQRSPAQGSTTRRRQEGAQVTAHGAAKLIALIHR
jgi:hypothetical protein